MSIVSFILVVFGFFLLLLLLSTKYYQAKTVIFFVVEGSWDTATLHLFLDLVHHSNGLTAATQHLTGYVVEQNNVWV